VGVVFQKLSLCRDGAENIAFGRPRADRGNRARSAAGGRRRVYPHLPKGYDTELREGEPAYPGSASTAALARSLLHDPRILLLDDPTAAVDSHTEREILGASTRPLRNELCCW
jgi:ATP-binding cassette subfamily B protein